MTNFQLNHNCTTQQVFQRETLGICFINLPPSLHCRNFALCRIVTEHIQACRSLSKIHGIWLDTANPRLKAAIPRKEALEARKASFIQISCDINAQSEELWLKLSFLHSRMCFGLAFSYISLRFSFSISNFRLIA